MNEQDENRLDNFLRDKLSGYQPVPSPRVWAGIEQRVGAPKTQLTRRFGRILPVLMSALVGVLIGWMWPREAGVAAAGQTAVVSAPATEPQRAAGQAVTQVGTAAESVSTPEQPAQAAEMPVMAPAAVAQAPVAQAPAAGTPDREPSGVTPRAVRPLGHPMAVAPTPATGAAPVTAPTPAAGTAPAATPATATSAVSPTDIDIPATVAVSPVISVALGTIPTRFTPPTLAALVDAEYVVQAQGNETSGTSRARLLGALQIEKVELVKLQRRVDSLLRVLEPTLATGATGDSTTARHKPEHRWSAAVAFTPEHTFLGLQAPAENTAATLRRNHEAGRGSMNASVMGEYHLNNQLSVGLGVGYSTYGAELRLTNRETEIIKGEPDVKTVTTTQVGTSDNIIWSQQLKDSVMQASPIYNSNGQVVDFKYTYVYVYEYDTIIVRQTDTVRTTTRTITPTITTREVTTYKVLRPDYHFVTLPVMVRYRLTPATKGARWWADVAMGAQLQLFRGGSQLVTYDDGRTYQTERVGPHEGPFRPVNVALLGQLALNYGLSPRLSVSMAPAVRWQMQSVYKKETGLKQQPTATGIQFGVRWML